MKRRTLILSIILSLLLLCTGCQTQQVAPTPESEPETTALSDERVEELYTLSVQFTEYLSSGDIEASMEMMDATMTEAMDGKLEGTWTQLIDSAGSFLETGAYVGMAYGEYDILEMTLVFEKASLIQRLVFDSNNSISGLFYKNGEVAAVTESPLPEGIAETPVTVDSGDGYPLDGMLTMPKDMTPIGGIVLVHGSGPNDMNETVGSNGVFRDLAYSLAENGIAVLRYNKRTYTYGAEVASGGQSITLDDEVAKDAFAAVELMKSFEGIDGEKIYLLGHSMGGGLLSYINSLGGNCAGYIVMAGTPRNIWELSEAQNLLLAKEQEESGDKESGEAIRSVVEEESRKANGLAELSKDETVYGMPVEYLREFDRIDTVALHLTDGLPVLILQGEKDRQVFMTDYEIWQEALREHPNATFISYPTLNHLFGEYTKEAVPFMQMVSVEYAERTPVSDDVIKDITDWIAKLN
ncbi:alpha/beta fold hydrolase [Lachnospiraceae bacterium OttesenSCG-928-D06]|nr:alpha/beta fold hydrolase [Lachnospiraceae bacterium OttesenSCG-928-D06]